MKFDPKTRKLTSDADLWLTQKQIEDELQRSFSHLMYLGINDSLENYTEWTEEQKEQWEEEHRQREPDENAEMY